MLRNLLDTRRERVLQKWLDLILESFPPDGHAFLRSEKDRFCNPIGHTFRQETAALLGALIDGRSTDAARGSLDNIVKIRAVQDCSPSEAIAFVFLLKRAVREELADDGELGLANGELSAFELEVDRLALAAFDSYMACRERINRIGARAAEMRVAKLLERLSRQHADSGDIC